MFGIGGKFGSAKGMVSMPNLSGLTRPEAISAINNAGLFLGETFTISGTSNQNGKISSQTIASGTLVDYESIIGFSSYLYTAPTVTTTVTSTTYPTPVYFSDLGLPNPYVCAISDSFGNHQGYSQKYYDGKTVTTTTTTTNGISTSSDSTVYGSVQYTTPTLTDGYCGYSAPVCTQTLLSTTVGTCGTGSLGTSGTQITTKTYSNYGNVCRTTITEVNTSASCYNAGCTAWSAWQMVAAGVYLRTKVCYVEGQNPATTTEQKCDLIAQSYTDGACTSSGTLTRTYTASGRDAACNTYPAKTETVSCTYVAPTTSTGSGGTTTTTPTGSGTGCSPKNATVSGSSSCCGTAIPVGGGFYVCS